MSFSDSEWRRLHGASDRNLDLADEYLQKAQNCRDAVSAYENAKKALEYNPDCLEAEGLVAFLEARGDYLAYVRGMKKVLAHGEKLMREGGYYPDAVGHFWGILETRPYMRMLSGFADSLIYLKDYEGAALVMERMLKLNPADNQGVRWTLTHVYVMTGYREGEEKLAKNYPDDYSSAFWMGQALFYFKQGEWQRAKEMLRKIKDKNRGFGDFVEALGSPQKMDALRAGRTPFGVAMMSADELVHEYDGYDYAYQEAEGFEEWLKKVGPTL